MSVRFISDPKLAIAKWGATTRISPVWQIQPELPKDHPQIEEQAVARSIWFIQGVPVDLLRVELSVAELAQLRPGSLWLSLGAFSLVIIAPDSHYEERLRDICLKHSCHYESWAVLRTVSSLEFIAEPSLVAMPNHDQEGQLKENRTLKAFHESPIDVNDSIGFMQLELFSLIAVIESRATGAYSSLFSDALAIEKLAREILNGETTNDEEQFDPHTAKGESLYNPSSISRPDILLTLNAGLSRQVSQALSGTSPIIRTECHFWPHSLLGIGVACLALRNVAEFLTNLTQATLYDRRVYALKDKQFSSRHYKVTAQAGRPDFYKIDKADIVRSANLELLSEAELEEYTVGTEFSRTPITYFSGRDGFLNSLLTASAPLASVAGANSYQWNLGTITHEISHRILGGHLADIIEGTEEADGFLDDMLDLQNSGEASVEEVDKYFAEEPTTFNEYARKMIGRVLLSLHARDLQGESLRDEMLRPFDFFFEANERYALEIEEILVHVFDFYHFYGADTENYCNFIWQSWAVLPSIAEKLEEYVRRTLTAIGVQHIDRDNWIELSIHDFRGVLDVEPLRSSFPLRDELVDVLEDSTRRSELETDLKIYHDLHLVFHMLFKHDGLQQEASEELYVSPEYRVVERSGRKERRYYSYRNSAGVFSTENPAIPRPAFTNPLIFLRNYSREGVPNAAQSAWLLHMLAFNLDLKREKDRARDKL